jgi:folate-binding protein YgfZ
LIQDNSNGYTALRAVAGLLDRSHLGRILLTGADRRSYLQGLLTNDVEALTAGTGCYAALLNARGRMISDMRVLELGDAVLLDVPAALAEPVRAHLDRFVFSEDVQVRDVTAERAEVGLYGPAAATIASRVLHPTIDLSSLPIYGSVVVRHGDHDVLVVRSDEPGVAGFDFIVDAAAASSLAEALRGAGAVDVTREAADVVRVEAGRPRFGEDMDEETIPLEAGIEDRAISRTKGCYVGQEVIVRVLDRGQGRVARHLVGLVLTSAVERGAAITAGDRDIGRITSVAHSPALDRWIALGYVHRDQASEGTPVMVGGTPASVRRLPFVE